MVVIDVAGTTGQLQSDTGMKRLYKVLANKDLDIIPGDLLFEQKQRPAQGAGCCKRPIT